MRARYLLFRSIAFFAMGLASPLAAQEACIVCTGPERAYVCSVEKSDKISKFAGADKAIQYACIKEMARIGNHDTCRVRRDADVTVCNGIPQTVLLGSLLEAAEQQEAAANLKLKPTQKADPVKPPPGSSPPDAPKTMVELARRANEQSGEQIKQAGNQVKNVGEKVGGAVQNTWNCVISLFQRC